MATRLKDKIKKMDAARRDKIEARAAELMVEEMSLRDLRRAHHLTQQRMAELLGVGQKGISRLEKRSDLLVSTLRSYLEAMGGRLRIVAEFPDRPPVILSNFTETDFQAVSEDFRRGPARPGTQIT